MSLLYRVLLFLTIIPSTAVGAVWWGLAVMVTDVTRHSQREQPLEFF